MFSDLNINDHMWNMKREIFGGFLFFSFVFGVNYILKNFLNEMSDEDVHKKVDQQNDQQHDNKDVAHQETESSYQKMMVDFTEHTMSNLDDIIDPELLNTDLKLTYEDEDTEKGNTEDKDVSDQDTEKRNR